MRWRSALLTASSAALLAGCGGVGDQAAPAPKPPRIPTAVASRLAAEADQVAALMPGTCEARDAASSFRVHVIASIGSVPQRYREPLMSAANSLASRLATCTVPAPPAEDDHGKGKKHRKHDKHGKDD